MKHFTEMPIILSKEDKKASPNSPRFIPMFLLNEEQAQTNHMQTLQRLAERGGISPDEAIAIMDRRKWKPIPTKAALEMLDRRISAVSF
jgi:hypothetical protein